MRRLGPVVRINWFQVITEINRFGISTNKFEDLIGVPRETVMGWKNLNSEPRHHDGEKLIELWCKVFDKAREDIPYTTLHVWDQIGGKPPPR